MVSRMSQSLQRWVQENLQGKACPIQCIGALSKFKPAWLGYIRETRAFVVEEDTVAALHPGALHCTS